MTIKNTLITLGILLLSTALSAQTDQKRYMVVGGVMQEVVAEQDSIVLRSVNTVQENDTVKVLSARQIRKQERAAQDADSTFQRYSKLFRDTIPISRMCAISLVAPGFSQLYNKQAWKIPILYAVTGTTTALAIQQNSKYKGYKNQYDAMVRLNASQDELSPVQREMIKYNTNRQILLFGAVASYIYFIADGAINYHGKNSSVKIATTLSTICPGAGQVYNGSYWKVPIVIGGFASLGYMIDWNNRGYKRFKLAYDILTDGNDATVDEFGGKLSQDQLRNWRNNYRRNRDLCIIAMAGFYIFNIVDAHVDAHLRDYDISDDLAINIQPITQQLYTQKNGSTNTIGLGVTFRF